MRTHIFAPQHKCPRCGSKAIYYRHEGPRISTVHCDLCTANWKEQSNPEQGDCGFYKGGTIYIHPVASQ